MIENKDLKKHLKSLEKKLAIVYLIGLLVLVSLALVSNFILKEQAAKQATSLIKRTVQRGDYREVVFTLNDAKLDYFNAVVYYSEDGSKLFSLPAQLDPEFVNQTDFISRLLYTKLNIDLFFDSTGQQKIGNVLFIFGRFSHVPYSFLIWLFFVVSTMPLVRSSRLRVIENYNRQMFLLEEATRADLARRVRHDIRSPLGALQIVTFDLPDLNPKQRSIIQRATERITEIVSELELIRVSKADEGQKIKNESLSPQAILTLTQEIVQEKRTQLIYKSSVKLVTDFSPDSFFLFALVKSSEFKRTLSNIIDNAIEACGSTGQIVVSLRKDVDSAIVEVVDNGHGIDEKDLGLVLQKNFTKKKLGSGLGLYYADKTIREFGGTLSIRSKVSAGTTISIRLPNCAAPSWYVPSINVPLNGSVVILDDQESIHLSWKMRLDEIRAKGANFSVVCLKSAQELATWHREHEDASALYLLDYDLGNGEPSGLDLARDLKLTSNAILVTGHFDSEDIQKRCSDQHIGLLPKSYLSQVQIKSV